MTHPAFMAMATRLTLIYAATYCATVFAAAFLTDGLVLTEKGVVGSDFLAFYTAGDFAREGAALRAYDFEAFDARLKARAPLEQLGMMWQYPPTMFFILAPFALLPYKAGYVLWIAAGWAALLLALRHVEIRGRALVLLGLSPLCVVVVDNGQIAMGAAALVFVAAYRPKERWLAAGVAAGLLTIKPQLGLLLPLVYLAGGAWRTIAVAAATAVVFHAPSVLVFGLEGWGEFIAAAARLNADVTGPALHTPPNGMATLFGQLRVMGAPSAVALPAQYVFSALAALAVVAGWRRTGDPLARMALVSAAAALVSPYAYGYETPLLIGAAALIARQADSYRSPAAIALIAVALYIILTPAAPELLGAATQFPLFFAAFASTLMIVFRPAGFARAAFSPAQDQRARAPLE